jgi:hypothetical protein
MVRGRTPFGEVVISTTPALGAPPCFSGSAPPPSLTRRPSSSEEGSPALRTPLLIQEGCPSADGRGGYGDAGVVGAAPPKPLAVEKPPP